MHETDRQWPAAVPDRFYAVGQDGAAAASYDRTDGQMERESKTVQIHRV